MIRIADRINGLGESETLLMAALTRKLRATGIDVIDLSLGEPDFDTPVHIRDAAKQAMDEGFTHYTPVAGYLDVRQAICDKLKRDNGLTYSPDNIVVSTGAKQSLMNVFYSVVNPGDEVILPTPYWVSYREMANLNGAVKVELPTTIDTNYKITSAQLEQAITTKTRAFCFSSPCNPSGSVYNHNELAALAEVFRAHPDIVIISDEIYEYINYKGKHETLAQFDFLKDRTVVINGMSKGFAMTGWRIGYMAAPDEIVKACVKLQGQFTSGANSIAQRASLAALTSSLQPTMDMVAAFAERRKEIIELLSDIPGIKCNNPDGAFYVFPDVSHYFGKKLNDTYISNADDLAMYIINKAHVSIVSGSAFANGNCVRMAYSNSIENIRIACERMKDALALLH